MRSSIRHLRATALLSSLMLASALLTPLAALTAEPAESATKSPITQQVSRDERVLKASDVDGVMRLYARDAVLMPQHSLRAVGRDAVSGAYRHVFSTIKLGRAESR